MTRFKLKARQECKLCVINSIYYRGDDKTIRFDLSSHNSTTIKIKCIFPLFICNSVITIDWCGLWTDLLQQSLRPGRIRHIFIQNSPIFETCCRTRWYSTLYLKKYRAQFKNLIQLTCPFTKSGESNFRSGQHWHNIFIQPWQHFEDKLYGHDSNRNDTQTTNHDFLLAKFTRNWKKKPSSRWFPFNRDNYEKFHFDLELCMWSSMWDHQYPDENRLN